ncbi:MAG TPA: hypothetical protein VGI40_08670, partial [Pirellulaceae bacterium]
GNGAWLAGTVDFRDSNNYTGTTLINPRSTLLVEAVNGINGGGDMTIYGILNISNGSVNLAAGKSIDIRRGGALSISMVGPGVNQLSDGTPIAMTSATLTYNGFSNTYAETIGAITAREYNTITLNSTNVAYLTLGGLARGTGAQVNFTATHGVLGDVGERIFITGQPAGFVGSWAYQPVEKVLLDIPWWGRYHDDFMSHDSQGGLCRWRWVNGKPNNRNCGWERRICRVRPATPFISG